MFETKVNNGPGVRQVGTLIMYECIIELKNMGQDFLFDDQ